MKNTGKRKTLLSWSSGKDSAWALHLLRQDPTIELAGLVTTMNSEFDRVAMHAVRRTLLEEQARAAGLEPWIVELPYPCDNEEYERIMGSLIERAKASGITTMAFGDLFLEDIREYREEMLAGTGIEPLFPLWNSDTRKLAHEMQAAGLQAYVTCVDPRCLDRAYAGRVWDSEFIEGILSLPGEVDPCGEKGEFHTFAFSGPMFSCPIGVKAGEVVERDGFVYADLIPE